MFYNLNGYDYTKFVLTNVHWTYYTSTSDWGTVQEADAAGFYRLHIWGDDRDVMPANSAFLCVRNDQLPVALWNQGNAPAYTLAIRGGNQPTGMGLINTDGNTAHEQWFTLGGIQLEGRPTTSGVYIYNGHKVHIKRK